MAEEIPDPGQLSEEQLRAAYEQEIKRVRVEHVLLENVVTIVNLGMRRTGLMPGTEDERDLGQVELAIESVRALLPQIEQIAPQQVAPIRDAVSQLQMAFVQAQGGEPLSLTGSTAESRRWAGPIDGQRGGLFARHRHQESDRESPGGRERRESPRSAVDASGCLGSDRRYSAPMFILIVGCGRVGSAIAKRSLDAGHDVSVMDIDPLSHERLDRDQTSTWEDAGGQFTVGTALEVDGLIEAGIEQADVFMAATSGDNTNLVISQIAQRRFNVPRVVVRVADPARAAWYAEQGLQTICPTQVAIDQAEHVLLSR